MAELILMSSFMLSASPKIRKKTTHRTMKAASLPNQPYCKTQYQQVFHLSDSYHRFRMELEHAKLQFNIIAMQFIKTFNEPNLFKIYSRIINKFLEPLDVWNEKKSCDFWELLCLFWSFVSTLGCSKPLFPFCTARLIKILIFNAKAENQ